MILPDKYIPLEETYLGLGWRALRLLERPQTVNSLWRQMKDIPEVASYQRFILTLDFLFLLHAIELGDDLLLRRCT